MVPILVGLGTNLGDRLAYLREAVQRLEGIFAVEKVSRVVESPAMYLEDQPPYLNAAILAYTELSPRRTLVCLKGIEREMGRAEQIRYGPREIDLDLLAYGSLQYLWTQDHNKRLQIPHPRTPERAFVLRPLAEICPDFGLPGLGVVRELLDNLGEAAEAAQWIPDAVLPIHRL